MGTRCSEEVTGVIEIESDAFAELIVASDIEVGGLKF